MTNSLHSDYKSLQNEHPKLWVFRRLQKTGRDDADVTWLGRAFQLLRRSVVSGQYNCTHDLNSIECAERWTAEWYRWMLWESDILYTFIGTCMEI